MEADQQCSAGKWILNHICSREIFHHETIHKTHSGRGALCRQHIKKGKRSKNNSLHTHVHFETLKYYEIQTGAIVMSNWKLQHSACIFLRVINKS